MIDKMNKLTIIIPLHKFDDDISAYLNKSLESINKQVEILNKPTVLLVCDENIANDVTNFILNKFNTEIKVLANPGKIDYQSQVNYAVDFVDTEYFTVVEFDDEISVTYIKNVEKHIDSYNDVAIFLPMIIEVDGNGRGVKFTNETVWSQQFVSDGGEMGYLNIKSLKEMTDFKLSGAVIKKSDFISIGKYKVNIKLTFMLEFLLRAMENTCKVYTIPKIIYKHLDNRDGSLFNEYLKSMSISERKFWFDVAFKEYNFTNDRVIDITKLDEKK